MLRVGVSPKGEHQYTLTVIQMNHMHNMCFMDFLLNTMKDKWNEHKLHSMLVQEETRLKNLRSHSVHYVSHQGNQGAKKKFMEKHVKARGD